MDSTPSLAGVVGEKALPRGPHSCRGSVIEEPGHGAGIAAMLAVQG